MSFSDFSISGGDSGLLLSATVAIALAVIAQFVLTRTTHRLVRQADDSDGGADPAHERRAQTWFAHAVNAAATPISVLLWTYAIHFALTQLARFFITDAKSLTQVLESINWVRGALAVVLLFWLLLRLGRFIDRRLSRVAKSTATSSDDIVLPLVGKCIRATLPLLAVMLGASALEVSPETRALIRDATSLIIIATVAFVMFQTVDAFQELVLRRYRIDVQDNYRARGVHTQVLMLKRVAVVLIGVLTFASMLMVFDSVRRFGTTILASAGVAGIVIGFAAQRSIATLLAGFQIALTQPIRIDDAVIVENEWGRIEEITLTYVVINLWDMRRLVVPITYFIEKPFQNWTRTSAQILGAILLYLDYEVPLDKLRAEFERVVRASPLWDGHVSGIQVTDSKEHCIEVRALVSASDAGRAFDLRCEVREKLLVWLAEHYPQSLPKARLRPAKLDLATPVAE